MPRTPAAFSALPAAARQMSRMRCAASISPIGQTTGSSQISICFAVANQRIAIANLPTLNRDSRDDHLQKSEKRDARNLDLVWPRLKILKDEGVATRVGWSVKMDSPAAP